MKRLCFFLTLALLTAFTSAAFAQQKNADSSKKPEQAKLEKKFRERLSGAALIGTFTVDGKNDQNPPRPERYEITRVTKLQDDYWTFMARVQYGDKNTTVPITLQVFWAGDTPVISLTDLTIPGLGTYTARVMIYEDRYAGTWQHGKVGGHMWGRIEPIEETAESSSP